MPNNGCAAFLRFSHEYHITRQCSLPVSPWQCLPKRQVCNLTYPQVSPLQGMREDNQNQVPKFDERPCVQALTHYSHPSRSTSSSGNHLALICHSCTRKIKLLHGLHGLAALGRRGVFDAPGIICQVFECARKMTSPTDGNDSTRSNFAFLLR
jgi:hypothetical protein